MTSDRIRSVRESLCQALMDLERVDQEHQALVKVAEELTHIRRDCQECPF